MGFMFWHMYLYFVPSFPSDWQDAKVHLPYGKPAYNIHFVINLKPKSTMTICVDGARYIGDRIEFTNDGRVHEVKVEWRDLC